MTLLDKKHYCCRVCELITTSFYEFHISNCIRDFLKISNAIQMVMTKKQLNKQDSFHSPSWNFENSDRKMRELMWCAPLMILKVSGNNSVFKTLKVSSHTLHTLNSLINDRPK